MSRVRPTLRERLLSSVRVPSHARDGGSHQTWRQGTGLVTSSAPASRRAAGSRIRTPAGIAVPPAPTAARCASRRSFERRRLRPSRTAGRRPPRARPRRYAHRDRSPSGRPAARARAPRTQYAARSAVSTLGQHRVRLVRGIDGDLQREPERLRRPGEHDAPARADRRASAERRAEVVEPVAALERDA